MVGKSMVKSKLSYDNASPNSIEKHAKKLLFRSLAELGCIVDVEVEDEWGIKTKERCEQPAELHHPTKDAGMGQRSPHEYVIPLCPKHHRTGGHGVALHAGQETWEKKFGTEAELIIKRNELLGRY